MQFLEKEELRVNFISRAGVLTISLDDSLLVNNPSQLTTRRCKLKQSLTLFFLTTMPACGIPVAV